MKSYESKTLINARKCTVWDIITDGGNYTVWNTAPTMGRRANTRTSGVPATPALAENVSSPGQRLPQRLRLQPGRSTSSRSV